MIAMSLVLLSLVTTRVSSGHWCEADGCDMKAWTPFKLPEETTFVDYQSLISHYARWHRDTLNDVTIACWNKEIIVFTPVAGLGDSIDAAVSAFALAIRHGR